MTTGENPPRIGSETAGGKAGKGRGQIGANGNGRNGRVGAKKKSPKAVQSPPEWGILSPLYLVADNREDAISC